MSSIERSDLPGLLSLCQTPEDFAQYDLWEADVVAREAKQGKWIARTLGEVAEFLGVALQTVKQWRMETPAMPGDDGKYDLQQVVKWRLDKVLQSDLAAAKRQQDFELGKIQVETKQIELDREKGLILDRHDVELWAAQQIVRARETIMQLPEMLAASAPQDLKDFVRSEADRHCRGVLDSLSRGASQDNLLREMANGSEG